MTNTDRTLIGILVDRSGSMTEMRRDMELGIAELLDAQRLQPGSCDVTLAQFDTHYETVYPPTPVDRAPHYTLIPRWGTALLDGVGRFVTQTGATLARRAEQDRPGRVLIVIATDGEENSSRHWSTQRVRDLIVQQRDVYRWEFVFLGANIDSFSVAESFGIPRNSTIDFADPINTMNSVSNYATSYRLTGAAGAFTDVDRSNAMGSK